MTAHPAPLVSSRDRDARPEEIPSAASKFRAAVEASGWSVRATYGRGWGVAANGGVGPLRETLALRCRRGAQRAVLVWGATAWPVFGRGEARQTEEQDAHTEGKGVTRTTWTWHPPMSWHPDNYRHEGDWRPTWKYEHGWYWAPGIPRTAASISSVVLRKIMREVRE